MSYNPKNMLVTGGAGFIGSNFIRYVLQNYSDITIINLDKLTYAGDVNNIDIGPHNRYHFIQGDICDPHLIRHVLQHNRIDTIVNFAAESHVDRSIAEPEAFVDTNIKGTFVLLEAAKHHWFEVENCSPLHCRFHQISTDEVYGSLKLDETLSTENSSYKPRSPYAASKAGADHLVFSYFNTYGLPITISRCTNNYGPFQHDEKFVPTIIRSCLSQQPIPVYGNGKNIRDWLYVEDHCSGIMKVICNGRVGESYNMSAMNEWENLTLANYICEMMDELNVKGKPHRNLIIFVEDRLGHDFRYAIDPQKIVQQLDWHPIESMQSGLQKTIQFYMSKIVIQE